MAIPVNNKTNPPTFVIADIYFLKLLEKDKNLRLFAEFENFRKRTARERIEILIDDETVLYGKEVYRRYVLPDDFLKAN